MLCRANVTPDSRQTAESYGTLYETERVGERARKREQRGARKGRSDRERREGENTSRHAVSLSVSLFLAILRSERKTVDSRYCESFPAAKIPRENHSADVPASRTFSQAHEEKEKEEETAAAQEWRSLFLLLSLCLSRNIPFASATCREGGNNVQRVSRRAGRRGMKTVSCDFTKFAPPKATSHGEASPTAAIIWTKTRKIVRRAHARLVVYLSACARKGPLLFQALSLSLSLAHFARVRVSHSTNGKVDAFFCRSLHLAFPQSTAKRHCERTTCLRRLGGSSSCDLYDKVETRWNSE